MSKKQTRNASQDICQTVYRRISKEELQEIAVDVLRTDKLSVIIALKQLLSNILPTRAEQEKFLLDAVYRLVEQDAQAAKQILLNYRYLQPELDLALVTQQCISERLQAEGFLQNRDFWFDAEGQLKSSATVREFLLSNITGCDRLLGEIIFPDFFEKTGP